MAQFKNYFSGEAEPPNKRITSSQKCFRSTDIDEVGDSTHLTLFEMLGNFSFGDYFKEEACEMALNLMVNELGFDLENIFITVHNDDIEAKKIWLVGIPDEKISFFGDSDNWWGPAEMRVSDHAVNCIITLAKKILIKKLKIMIINGDQMFMKTL